MMLSTFMRISRHKACQVLIALLMTVLMSLDVDIAGTTAKKVKEPNSALQTRDCPIR